MDASISKSYDDKFAYRVDSLIWDHFVKPFVRKTLRDAANGGASRYLDFATGTGRVLKVGHQIFGSSTGIDISANMLEEARRRVPEAVLHCLDVTRDDVPELRKFDCVTMFRFLRNAEPELRSAVLDWLFSHMQPGGTLVVNNHGNSSSLRCLVARLAFWLPDEARNQISRDETYAMLERAGFSVVSCQGFQILPSVFGRPVLGRWLQIKAERLCRKLGLERFGGELVVVARRK